jgi:hypothetical protein
MEANALREKREELAQQVNVAKSQLQRLHEGELATLLKELAELEIVPILQSDYEMKIARQVYYKHKQDKVIEEIIAQRTRHAVLGALYEHENKRSSMVVNLLTLIAEQLAQLSTEQTTRLRLMKETQLSVSTDAQRQTVISDRESVFYLIYLLLKKISTDEPQFLTERAIAAEASELAAAREQTEKLERTLASTQESELGKITRSIQRLEEMLIPESSEGVRITPRELQDVHHSFETRLKELEVLLTNIINERTHKQKIVKSSSEDARKERILWSWFFTRPEKLRAELHALEEKRNSRLIK